MEKLNLNPVDLSFENSLNKEESIKGNIPCVMWQAESRTFRLSAKAACYNNQYEKGYLKPLKNIDITLSEKDYNLLLPELVKIIDSNPVVQGIVMKAIMSQLNQDDKGSV